MNLAIASDYCGSTGDPLPRLKAAAEAGFTHIHWCHQWCTDFIYTEPELKAIKKTMKECGLTLLDIHGSAGSEKVWYSKDEYRRQAGVLLVRNRMEMFADLEGVGALMMHIPGMTCNYNYTDEERAVIRESIDQQRKSLDELMPFAEKYHCPIAVENMPDDSFEVIGELMRDYPVELMGITYDSGHGHIRTDKGLDHIEQYKDRLMALHLHDNDGTGDQHQPPFYGTIDWARLASILDSSAYDRPLSYEMTMTNTPFHDKEAKEQTPEAIAAFLKDAHERCTRFANMTTKFK